MTVRLYNMKVLQRCNDSEVQNLGGGLTSQKRQDIAVD
jgi:hypothetical protein